MSVQSDRQFFQRVGSRGIGPTLGDGTSRGGLLAPTSYTPSEFASPSGVADGQQTSQPVAVNTIVDTWVHLRRDATQSIAAGAGDGISWDTEVAFPAATGTAMFASLPTDTLTSPFDGMLHFTFGSRWDAGATPGTDVQVEVNGTLFDTSRTYLTPTSPVETWQPETQFFPVASGDTIRFVIGHDQGTAQTLLRADLWVLIVGEDVSTVPTPVSSDSPEFIAVETSITNSVAYPAGIEAGDLLLITSAGDNNPTIAAAGWELVWSTGTQVATGAFYRAADGTETGSVTVTNASRLAMTVWRGADTREPFLAGELGHASTSSGGWPPLPQLVAPFSLSRHIGLFTQRTLSSSEVPGDIPPEMVEVAKVWDGDAPVWVELLGYDPDAIAAEETTEAHAPTGSAGTTQRRSIAILLHGPRTIAAGSLDRVIATNELKVGEAASSDTFTVPDEAQAGDVMLVWAGFELTAPSDTLAGWTLVDTVTDGTHGVKCWRRTLTGGDPGTSYTLSVAVHGLHHVVYRGVDTSAPVVDSQTAQTGVSDSSVTLPSTSTVAGGILAAMAFCRSTAGNETWELLTDAEWLELVSRPALADDGRNPSLTAEVFTTGAARTVTFPGTGGSDPRRFIVGVSLRPA